jgi:hypothetical protein
VLSDSVLSGLLMPSVLSLGTRLELTSAREFDL